MDWQTANQRSLVAALGRVRAALERHAGTEPAVEGDAVDVDAAGAPSALDRLCATFGLSDFERDVLLLSAGPELDGSFLDLVPEGRITFGLALTALSDPHWSALSPDRPLRRWRLIDVDPGEALASSQIRVDERVLHHLTGVSTLDERLRGLVAPVEPGPPPAPSSEAAAERIASLWAAVDERRIPPPIQICGPDPSARHAVAAAACATHGLALFAVDAADLPTTPAERVALARLWEREAALLGGALLIDCDEGHAAATLAFLAEMQGVRLVGTREPLRSRFEPILRVDVPALQPGEQRRAWRRLVKGAVRPDELDAVAQQFRLGPEGMEAAAADVRTGAALWDACRAQARPRLDDLAQRIEPAASRDDLVLPEAQLATLREIAIHVARRATVYEEWGFAARGARGLGISALFAGPSGTGKTMAAEVLANELRLDLYRIDLSAVVSKYIGETEKNLRRVFDAAEEGGAILLFDEADALFGKRSEVKDSHDRYANIEVSYLLQRMEAYRGLAILTTNQKSALDPSFLRRLRFVVQFPFPDAEQRAEIWRRVFPAGTPREGLDHEQLARLNVAGGNIRNIAL
ncbi:MAG: ATP-binding protein, partial [Actinobacteria bacterium]